MQLITKPTAAKGTHRRENTVGGKSTAGNTETIPEEGQGGV
jgi:hypothetical protein